MNWIDATVSAICDECKGKISPIIRKRQLDDAVDNIIGKTSDYVPLQPKEIYPILCQKDQEVLRMIIVSCVIEQENRKNIKSILEGK